MIIKEGIDGKPFKLQLAKEMYGDQPLRFQVITEPEECIIKSKWSIVNWYRKMTNTEERGYKYAVKIVEQ